MARQHRPLRAPAQDTGRARSFYESVFGWSFRDAMPEFEYLMTENVEPAGADLRAAVGRAGADRLLHHGGHRRLRQVRDQGGEADDKQPIPKSAGLPAARTPRATLLALPAGRLRPAAQRLTVSRVRREGRGRTSRSRSPGRAWRRTTGAGEPGGRRTR